MLDHDENKRAYLLATYSDKTAIAAKLRDRVYQLTRNFVLGAFAVSGFLAATPEFDLTVLQRLVGLVAVLSVTVLSVHLIHSSYQVLYSVLGIIANLERAMGFHERGLYLTGTLYPENLAAPEKLASGVYDRGSERRYKLAVCVSGLVSALAFCIL